MKIFRLFVLAALTATSVPAQELEKITLPNAIAGTINVGFISRTKRLATGEPASGVKDNYSVGLSISKTTDLNGKAEQLPHLSSTPEQIGTFTYELDIGLINPADPTKKTIFGKWEGSIAEKNGNIYDFAGNKHQIRMDVIGSLPAFSSPFGGTIQGKGKKAESITSYTRKLGDKDIKIEVANVRSIRFDNAILATGPSQSYPQVTVTGTLDFDEQTGNMLTNGIHFSYVIGGKQYNDVVTGSIKWVEDPRRTINGKGSYDFNLRWNEESPDPTKAKKDEEGFFSVVKTDSSLTGTISHEDTLSTIKGKDVATGSKTTYQLDANQLTKQQIMNFAKLWVASLGPINELPTD